MYTVHPAFEDGTDTGFRNVGQLQFDAGEIPRRKYTIFKSRRKSQIKNNMIVAEQQSSSVSVLPTSQHSPRGARRTGFEQTLLKWLRQLLPMACFPIWKSKHMRFKVTFHFRKLRIEMSVNSDNLVYR